MAMVPEITPHRYPPCDLGVAPPALGDLNTRQLIEALYFAANPCASVRTMPQHLRLDRRHATPDDVRRELRRRSAVGHA